jgi:hypothetical protein
LVPTRANTQPAFGRYLAVPGTEVAVSTDRQTRYRLTSDIDV